MAKSSSWKSTPFAPPYSRRRSRSIRSISKRAGRVRSRRPIGRERCGLGPAPAAQAMVALHDAIQRKLTRLGYRAEHRRFVPHLTLGRVGRDSPPRPLVRELAGLAEYEAGTMLVDEVTVFASKLTSDGPMYEVLARAPLAE